MIFQTIAICLDISYLSFCYFVDRWIILIQDKVYMIVTRKKLDALNAHFFEISFSRKVLLVFFKMT